MIADSIEILNVGPIRSVKLDLNKVNVFMGEQSSGKSTIAKIISFCAWVEKDVAIHQSFKNYNKNNRFFIERLETFHKMKGYFNPNSYIKYISNTLVIEYSSEDFKIDWNNKFGYKRNKISYIPSERSIAILPEIEKVEFPNNYLKSFLFDWLDARKLYSKSTKLSLLDIGIDFYYSENTKESYISNTRGSYDILLSQASSGLQSITPLIAMIDHLTNKIYLKEQNISYELDEIKMQVTRELVTQFLIKPIYGKEPTDPKELSKMFQDLGQKIASKEENATRHFDSYKEVEKGLFETHSTNIILEEPEQNLFPSTQKSLIYYLLECVNKNTAHRLTLTTHSPYVLYAINNCIMASITSEKIPEREKNKLNCISSEINPSLISIYEIKDGTIERIQQEDGLIGDNFFDKKMKDVMDEFYIMLNHY